MNIGRLLHNFLVGAAGAALSAIKDYIDTGGIVQGDTVEALVFGAVLALVSRLLGTVVGKLRG